VTAARLLPRIYGATSPCCFGSRDEADRRERAGKKTSHGLDRYCRATRVCNCLTAGKKVSCESGTKGPGSDEWPIQESGICGLRESRVKLQMDGMGDIGDTPS